MLLEAAAGKGVGALIRVGRVVFVRCFVKLVAPELYVPEQTEEELAVSRRLLAESRAELDAAAAHSWTGEDPLSRDDLAGADADLRKALEIAPPDWKLRDDAQPALDELKRRPK